MRVQLLFLSAAGARAWNAGDELATTVRVHGTRASRQFLKCENVRLDFEWPKQSVCFVSSVPFHSLPGER